MSAFSHYFKDFAIVYYVTMAPYNCKIFEIPCLIGRARIGVFSESIDVHQVHTIIGFPMALLYVVDIFGCPLRR